MIDFHLLTQGLVYFITCVCGLVVAITIGVNRSNFQGICILYGKIDWEESVKFLLHGSSASNCNFPIYFCVFGIIFYGLMNGLYNIYAMCRSRKEPSIGTQMWVMPFLLVNVVLSFITLIVACMISVGYKQFCDGYINGRDNIKCSYGETAKWTSLDSGDAFDPGPYSVFMSVAMAAVWLCLLFHFIQIALGVLRFVRNRRLRGGARQDKSTSDKKKFGNVEPTA